MSSTRECPTRASRCRAPAKIHILISSLSIAKNLRSGNSSFLKILLFRSFQTDQLIRSTRVPTPCRRFCWIVSSQQNQSFKSEISDQEFGRERGSLPNLPQLSKLAWRKGNRQKDEELSPSSVHKEDRNSSSAIHEVATFGGSPRFPNICSNWQLLGSFKLYFISRFSRISSRCCQFPPNLVFLWVL